MEVQSKFVTLKNQIEGAPQESNFEIKETSLKQISNDEAQLIVKNLYVSIDPYQLNRMKSLSSTHSATKYANQVKLGQAIDAHGVGRVVVCGDERFKEGDLVVGHFGWEEYTLINTTTADGFFRKIESSEFPPSYYLGILGIKIDNWVRIALEGISGLTAYAGFFNVCKPKKGDFVFVSAASGSVGNIVGQYAKLFGCYVVGSAGSNDKVDLLKNKLGFDDAFNYKEETDFDSALKRFFPHGIDIYFDNVGGELLEAAIANMNMFGRIAVCGVISEYTNKRRSAPNMLDVIYKRITIQGFLLVDYLHLFQEFMSFTCDQLRNDKIQAIEDISMGLESIPSAFVGLFNGSNVGKKLVQLE
ncbi:hypothetical protein Syun_005965 [Stephania yunnanensis]|uniref:Enoyl reductase (ER) domain-containing protein n=1 Tax=Stephania yunnanensis TaxID=152371 RepID=A0AAP0PYW2_9MAGN